MTDPVKNQELIFYASVVEAADPSKFVIDPTIAVGDFTLSRDGAAPANMANLPVVTPAGTSAIKFILTAAEMNADNINVFATDQAGSEWEEMFVAIDTISTTSQTVVDILEGDHIETSTTLIINKKNTLDPVLQKDITGSLLSPGVTIRTLEP